MDQRSHGATLEPILRAFLEQVEALISLEVAAKLAEARSQRSTPAALLAAAKPPPVPTPTRRHVAKPSRTAALTRRPTGAPAEKFPTRVLIDAQRHSKHNRRELEASLSCGCFHCGLTLQLSDIVDWRDSGETALCPRCDTAAVIGSASGHRTDGAFLAAMRGHWFGT